MSGPDIPLALDLLARQHDEVDVLLGELAAREGDLLRTRSLLSQALEEHMAIEEKVFYPALARVEMLGSFVSLLHDQHRVIRECIDSLLETDIEADGFQPAVHRLNEAVDVHVQDEEGRGFAYAVQHLAGDLDALAVEMEAQREAAKGAFGVG